MLTIENLHVYYGGIHALDGVSLKVGEGEIVCMIGANGAGKSTTLRTVSGIVKAHSGSIKFEDQELTTTSAHKIVERGLSHIPEGRRIFGNMSVMENLQMGAFARKERDFREDFERVFESFPRLKERQHQLGGTLSGGEQQMLAMARGLMSKPRLLVMDEPSMGLAPLLVREIFAIIKRINERDRTTILLVEQNANMALSVSHRAYVIETGRITLEGPSRDVYKDEAVKRAYLGT